MKASVILSPRETNEKDEERLGDKLMALVGYEVIRFSQARASRQTEGIPDRLYLHPARGRAVWWEAKSSTGKQRPEQMAFQALVEGCGMVYLCGPHDVLKSWLQRPSPITPVSTNG